MRARAKRTTGRRGFTVIELLVVIVIIAILLALLTGAGVAVLRGQKLKQAQNLMSSLDRALSDYMVENNDAPPRYILEGYVNMPGTIYHPDGGSVNEPSNSNAFPEIDDVAYPRHPDASVFVNQASGVGAVDAILEGLASDWLAATPQNDSAPNASKPTPSVLDPWSERGLWRDPWPVIVEGVRPVYYVHPRNELAQRLYGRCKNGKPYFMSAGPDGLYGTTTQLSGDGSKSSDAELIAQAVGALEDNVYSYEPDPADTSDDFNGMYR